MTAQQSDRITIDGQEYSLFAEPLEQYFQQHPPRPDFPVYSTANYRGYVASWSIEADRLFLVGLHCDDEAFSYLPTDLWKVASVRGTRLFAEWFTGRLLIPRGELLHYIHLGYQSIYEEELLIDVARGRITRRQSVDNRGRAEERMAELQLKVDFHYEMSRTSPKILRRLLKALAEPNAQWGSLLPRARQREIFGAHLAKFGPESTIESTQRSLRELELR